MDYGVLIQRLERLEAELRFARRDLDEVRSGYIPAAELTVGDGSGVARVRFKLSESSPEWDPDAPTTEAVNKTPYIGMNNEDPDVAGQIVVATDGETEDYLSTWIGYPDVTVSGAMTGTAFSFLDASSLPIALEPPIIISLEGQVWTPTVSYTLNADGGGFTTAAAPGGSHTWIVHLARRKVS